MTTRLEDSPAHVPPSPRRGPPRWIELIPGVVLVVAFGVMAVVRPHAVRDLFSGTQALLVTVGIVAGLLVLSRLLLPRFVRNTWVRVGALSTLAVALVLVLILPSVQDKKVVETFPRERAAASTPAADASEPAAPVKLASAELHGIDHDASGSAVIYRQPDGTFVVGLESIDIEPTPDSKVYVVPGSDREAPGDGGVFLEGLTGNQGTQYYAVPAGTDLGSGEWTVLIWCRAFSVPIANATPA